MSGDDAPMTETEPERRTVVGAILVNRLSAASRVGAARRADGGRLDGHWEFPGGKVEVGESHEQALCRELDEELSLEVRLGRRFDRQDGSAWPIGDRLELRLVFAEIADGELTPGPVHDQVTWVMPEDLDRLDWLPSDADAVAALQAFLTAGPQNVSV